MVVWIVVSSVIVMRDLHGDGQNGKPWVGGVHVTQVQQFCPETIEIPIFSWVPPPTHAIHISNIYSQPTKSVSITCHGTHPARAIAAADAAYLMEQLFRNIVW